MKVLHAHGPDDLHAGMSPAGWAKSPSRLAMLVIGTPGCGKTSSILVPQILLARGPVVAVTTKDDDLFRPTAQSRARKGKVWHYNPGNGPALPGTTELRWSPLHNAANWEAARQSGSFLTNEALDAEGGEAGNAKFFRVSALKIVTVLLHAAGLLDEDLKFVMRGLSKNKTVWRRVEEVISARGNDYARIWYDDIWSGGEETRDNVFSSAQLIFYVYATDTAFASTKAPNFDPLDFAKSTDTIYITADIDDQGSFAPLFVHLLRWIRMGNRMVQDAAKRSGKQIRPMYWALDELATMAPLKDFPQMVSQSGSTGLLITACVQDMSQPERLWGTEGKHLLTKMAGIAFPGITNRETLETLAMLTGKQWITKTSYSSSQSESYSASYGEQRHNPRVGNETFGHSSTSGQSTNEHFVEVTTPGDIYSGRIGTSNDPWTPGESLIWIHKGMVEQLQPMRYFNCSPFLETLAGNIVYAFENFRGDLALLPTPSLDFRLLSSQWQQRLQSALVAKRRRPRLAEWGS